MNHLSDELLWADLSTIGKALRARRVSSVALAEAALDQLETRGRQLNAVATVTRALALGEASQADRELQAGRDRGPLHGIPYGAKDLLDTAGIPTQWGSPTHQGRTPKQDAVAIRRLRDAGAVLVAKLAMVELAGGGGYSTGGASLHGPLRNPWDAGRWAGGSSSGSGAAVGGGLVPFAIGSETWGSIFCPSAFCSVTGLRPTYGRIPRTGAMALSWTMDKLGPMARSASDCRTLLKILSGPDAGEGSTAGLPPLRLGRGPAKPGQLRVGVLPEDYAKNSEPEIEKAFVDAIAILKKRGMRVGDAKLPRNNDEELPFAQAASLIIACEGAASFADLLRSGGFRKLVDEEQQAGLLAGLVFPAADYLRALQLRTVYGRSMARVFEDFDVLIAPTFLRVAPPVDINFNTYFKGGGSISAAANLCGLPGVSVPMGFGQGGLPVGLQINAAAGNERAVLDVAEHFQRATDWHRRRPDVPASRRGIQNTGR